MIHYNVYGDTSKFDFSVRGTIQSILRMIVKLDKIKGEHAISFIFVDSDKIHEINKKYRGIDKVTDVISFAAIDSTIDHKIQYELGDVYICVERLEEQAIQYGHSIKREFSFLVTHGTLHLLGYDHIKKEDEIIMFKKQDEVLEKLNITR